MRSGAQERARRAGQGGGEEQGGGGSGKKGERSRTRWHFKEE